MAKLVKAVRTALGIRGKGGIRSMWRWVIYHQV